MTTLPTGKLPPELLRTMLAGIEQDESVIVGPGIGRDAAAVRVGEQVLVMKTDPITFATDNIGWYLVNVNANDIACMGAEPRWLLITALLPENATTPELVESIFADIRRASQQVGCTLVGGHTEISEGLDRPILVGNMTGMAREEHLIDPTTARPGDAVLLIGGIAVEGTALLANEFRDQLAPLVDAATIERASRFLYDPGISVVDYARRLRSAVGTGVRALHDPTEGGLATGLHEIAEATDRGIRIDSDAIDIYPETRALAEALNIDPWGLIASGSLLAVIDRSTVETAINALRELSVPVSCIGHLTETRHERSLEVNGAVESLPEFAVDEVARLFSEA